MNSLLHPAEIAKLGDLSLRARAIVDGALAGLHRSPRSGASVDFAEHKIYSPGDEVRHIDWKAYGKFDKYYIKRFEEETELTAYLVVDASASMDYAGSAAAGGRSKLQYAVELAAALGYLLAQQRDRVGLVAFNEAVRAFLPARARRGHLRELCQQLDALRAEGCTDLARALGRVSEVTRQRSLVMLFSDLLNGSEDAIRLLRQLRVRHDVVLFHLLDHDEIELPFEGALQFEGMEEAGVLQVDVASVRPAYRRRVAEFLADCRRRAGEGDVEYQLVNTAYAATDVLLQFLHRRERR